MIARSFTRSTVHSRLRLAIAIALAVSSSGCQIAGLVADRVAGPKWVEAQYDPGKTTQLLVVAENFRAPTQSADDAERVARMVGDDIAAHGAALVVSPEKLSIVRDSRPGAYGKMSVVELGKAVGATQVLYIDLGGIGVGSQAGSDMVKGVANATVKVIDVNAGNVIFPQDLAEGVPVGFESPMRRASIKVTPDAVRAETIVGLTGKIARMFYRYQPSDLEALDTGL